MFVGSLGGHRLMNMRIENLPDCVNRFETKFRQRILKLLVNQLDAMTQRLFVAVACFQARQRSLEIIDDREKLQQHVVSAALIELAAFALNPFAVILKLGLSPEQLII